MIEKITVVQTWAPDPKKPRMPLGCIFVGVLLLVGACLSLSRGCDFPPPPHPIKDGNHPQERSNPVTMPEPEQSTENPDQPKGNPDLKGPVVVTVRVFLGPAQTSESGTLRIGSRRVTWQLTNTVREKLIQVDVPLEGNYPYEIESTTTVLIAKNKLVTWSGKGLGNIAVMHGSRFSALIDQTKGFNPYRCWLRADN